MFALAPAAQAAPRLATTQSGAPAGLAAATVKVGSSPVAVLAGGNDIWVANQGSDSVTEIDASTLQVLATIPVGSPPDSLAENPGGVIFVGSQTTNVVTEISVSTAEVVGTLDIGTSAEAPLLVASQANYSIVVTSARDGSLWWITSAGTVSKPVALGGTPAGLFGPANEPEQTWVTDPSTDTARIFKDASAGAITTVGVGSDPQGISFDPISQRMLVANEGDGTISEISLPGDTVTSTISAGVPAGGQFAMAADPSTANEVDPREGSVWVANTAADTLDAVNESTGQTTLRIPVGAGPDALAVSYPGIWVANKTDGTVTDVSLPVVTGPPSESYQLGQAVSLQLGVSPYPPVTLSAGLPSGLTLSPSGLISGKLAQGGLFDTAVQSSNVLGYGQDTFIVMAVTAPPAVSQSYEPLFDVGSAATEMLGYVAGYPAPTVTVTGTLPAGLTATCGVPGSDDNQTACAISGTPAANTSGAYHLTLTGSNGIGSPASGPITLTVDQAPAFLSANHVTFRRGTWSKFYVRTRALPVAKLTTSGKLPRGLRLRVRSNGSAVVYGKVARSVRLHSHYKVTISAGNVTDRGNTTTQVLRITVS